MPRGCFLQELSEMILWTMTIDISINIIYMNAYERDLYLLLVG